jgi:hypothetical protein
VQVICDGIVNVMPDYKSLDYAKRPPIAVGDSLALHLKNNGHLEGDPVAGRSPAEVLKAIRDTLDRDQNAYSGRDVILSSGASNGAGDVELAREQIRILKNARATVVLDGVGQGPGNAFTRDGINDKLARIAREEGGGFTGPLNPAQLWDREKIHLSPQGNKDLLERIRQLFDAAHAHASENKPAEKRSSSPPLTP